MTKTDEIRLLLEKHGYYILQNHDIHITKASLSYEVDIDTRIGIITKPFWVEVVDDKIQIRYYMGQLLSSQTYNDVASLFDFLIKDFPHIE